MKTLKQLSLLALFASTALLSFAQNGDSPKLLRIVIEDKTQEGVAMNMSIPLSMIKSLEPQINQMLSEFEAEQDQIDIRAIWNALRDSGPTDFVEINDGENKILVSTSEDELIVKVSSEKEENIQINIPLTIGDYLFSDTQTIDFDAIIEALEMISGHTLVTIDSPTNHGRIWIE